MINWLEEAEQELDKKKDSKKHSARVLDKKFRIQENYKKNKDKYDRFIAKLNELVDRVNNLPIEKKQPFGYINSKEKKSKLNNHLNYFSSSNRIEKLRFRGFLKLFKLSHYKNVRVIYFSVSRHIDIIGIEIKEHSLLKERIKASSNTDDKKGAKGSKHKDQERIHFKFAWDMNKLDDELAIQVISWLAFKEDIRNLPFAK
jgi:hypothetical protein